MAVIRIRAIEVLAASLERLCPALAGKIRAGHAPPSKIQTWPTLTIIPVSWQFHPDQDGDVWDELGDTRAVFNVGRYEATLQLRLGAQTSYERYELEHGLTQVFASQAGRPGVLVARITDQDCYNALISYELDDMTWQDEFAFEKKWFSQCNVTANVPALVERGGIYTIDEIRLTFTEDMDTAFASLPADTMETIAVDEYGNITVSSPTPP